MWARCAQSLTLPTGDVPGASHPGSATRPNLPKPGLQEVEHKMIFTIGCLSACEAAVSAYPLVLFGPRLSTPASMLAVDPGLAASLAYGR
jgi:hypothetical protein